MLHYRDVSSFSVPASVVVNAWLSVHCHSPCASGRLQAILILTWPHLITASVHLSTLVIITYYPITQQSALISIKFTPGDRCFIKVPCDLIILDWFIFPSRVKQIAGLRFSKNSSPSEISRTCTLFLRDYLVARSRMSTPASLCSVWSL